MSRSVGWKDVFYTFWEAGMSRRGKARDSDSPSLYPLLWSQKKASELVEQWIEFWIRTEGPFSITQTKKNIKKRNGNILRWRDVSLLTEEENNWFWLNWTLDQRNSLLELELFISLNFKLTLKMPNREMN